jgi:hypothetical protein
MPTDLLVLAGNASELLEQHGLVACGRRENGETRVDFWTRSGASYRYELKSEHVSVDAVVAACLSIAGIVEPDPMLHRRSSSLLS